MRIDGRTVSLSWIPSEAIGGAMKLPFEMGFTHYDDPPPDVVLDVEALQAEDKFRFANRVAAWVEVEAGQIVNAGWDDTSGVLMGSTTVMPGLLGGHEFEAFAMPVLRDEPEVHPDRVRFVQTTGGRTGLPAPRRVNRPPFVQWRAPLVWSTLALTIHADGRQEVEVVSASPFPRHWVYGPDGSLVAKSGLTDFKHWYRRAFGKHSPWGDESSPAVIAAAETALERQLSLRIMRGGQKPTVRTVKAGTELMRQGEQNSDIYLVLDGVVRVDKDGEALAELGPGCVVGERAVLEGGTRTATIVAVTKCRVAIAAEGQLDREALVALAQGHRREGT